MYHRPGRSERQARWLMWLLGMLIHCDCQRMSSVTFMLSLRAQTHLYLTFPLLLMFFRQARLVQNMMAPTFSSMHRPHSMIMPVATAAGRYDIFPKVIADSCASVKPPDAKIQATLHRLDFLLHRQLLLVRFWPRMASCVISGDICRWPVQVKSSLGHHNNIRRGALLPRELHKQQASAV